MKQPYLYVVRDDREYDYKSGFSSYTEANNYRLERQRCWMNHCDYVFLWTGNETVNLTKLDDDSRRELLKKLGIKE